MLAVYAKPPIRVGPTFGKAEYIRLSPAVGLVSILNPGREVCGTREFVVVTYSPMNTSTRCGIYQWHERDFHRGNGHLKDRRAATDQIITYLLNYRIISIGNYRKEIETYSERASSRISE